MTHRLALRRLIPAPADYVFAAMTQPAIMRRWVCPGDAVADRIDCDPVPGGRYAIDMKLADGTVVTVSGVYADVVAGKKLVYSWKWAHESVESLVTITLDPHGTSTDVTLVHENLATAESLDGHTLGWTACLEKLRRSDWAATAAAGTSA